MSTPAQIEIRFLQKTLTSGMSLNIEAFSVLAGEITAIVGPVGSGKTELVNLLTGQSQPASGSVRICGMNPMAERRRVSERVGVLFSMNNLYERFSARDNLQFHCRMRGISLQRADEVLNEVGLIDQANTAANKLLPSLARRLTFGRAVLHKPQVLLLMDPFSGCDPDSCALLSRLMRQQAQGGTAVLILAREGAGLASLCGAIYTIEGGRLSRLEIPHEAADGTKGEMPFKIPARQEGRVVLVNPAELLYVAADEDQTHLHTLQGEIPSHLSIGELEERLSRNGFFRAHRGYLVNLQHVKAFIPYTRDSYTLILDDPASTEIPLSKSAAKELRELLGY
jgi:ABC-2 type transport system ATP-binding protein